MYTLPPVVKACTAIILIFNFIIGDCSYAVQNICIVPSLISDTSINAERAGMVRAEIGRTLYPLAIAKGRFYQDLLAGKLPEKAEQDTLKHKILINNINNAIMEAAGVFYDSGNKLPSSLRETAYESLHNMLMFRQKISDGLYLFDSVVADEDNYLLGFSHDGIIGLSIDVVNDLSNRSVSLLGMYIFKQCMPQDKIINLTESAVDPVRDILAYLWEEETVDEFDRYIKEVIVKVLTVDISEYRQRKNMEGSYKGFVPSGGSLSEDSLIDVTGSPDGRYIASGGLDNHVTLYEHHNSKGWVPTYVLDGRRTASGSLGRVLSIKFMPDSKGVFISAADMSGGSYLHFFKYYPGSGWVMKQTLYDKHSVILDMDISSDGMNVVTINSRHQVDLYSRGPGEKWKLKRNTILKNKEVNKVKFFPEGRKISFSTKDDELMICEIGSNGDVVVEDILDDHNEQVSCIKISLDKKRIYLGTFHGKVFVYEAGYNGKFLLKYAFENHKNATVEDIFIDEESRGMLIATSSRKVNKVAFDPEKDEYEVEHTFYLDRAPMIITSMYIREGGKNIAVAGSDSEVFVGGETVIYGYGEKNPIEDPFAGGENPERAVRTHEGLPSHIDNKAEHSLMYKADILRSNLLEIKKDKRKEIIIAIDTDIGQGQYSYIMPLYRALDRFVEEHRKKGVILPEIKIVRRSGSGHNRLLEEINELISVEDETVDMKDILLITSKNNMDSDKFSSLGNRAWIAGIDVDDLDKAAYLPVFETITMLLVATVTTDENGREFLRSFYNDISGRPVSMAEFMEMLVNKSFNIYPKAADYEEIRRKYEIAVRIYTYA